MKSRYGTFCIPILAVLDYHAIMHEVRACTYFVRPKWRRPDFNTKKPISSYVPKIKALCPVIAYSGIRLFDEKLHFIVEIATSKRMRSNKNSGIITKVKRRSSDHLF